MGRERRSLLAGAAVFAIGAFDAWQGGATTAALMSGGIAVANLVALSLGARLRESGRLALYLANSAFAALMGYQTWAAGKQGLPYAWGLAAALFLVVGLAKHGARDESPPGRE